MYVLTYEIANFLRLRGCDASSFQPSISLYILQISSRLVLGQAPGGHNVIAGVYDYLKKCNPNSQLFGFLNGPIGVVDHQYLEVTDTLMNKYRNLGGFDMIRSGRHKIETDKQKHSSLQIARKLDLRKLFQVKATL